MLFWLLSNEAMALSCAWGIVDFNFEEGEVLPPDAILVGAHTYSEPDGVGLGPTILDEAEMPVPATVQWDPFVVTVVPTEPLQPGRYRLVEEGGFLFGEDGAAFQVADGLIVEPLDIPADLDVRRRTERSGEWGTTRGLDVSFTEVEGASHYEIELARVDVYANPSRAVTTWTSVFVGDGLCGATIEDYDHGVDSYVRVRAVGIDGTTSGWTTPAEVGPGALSRVVPSCSVAAGSPASALSLAALLGLLAVRRRR